MTKKRKKKFNKTELHDREYYIWMCTVLASARQQLGFANTGISVYYVF